MTNEPFPLPKHVCTISSLSACYFTNCIAFFIKKKKLHIWPRNIQFRGLNKIMDLILVAKNILYHQEVDGKCILKPLSHPTA